MRDGAATLGEALASIRGQTLGSFRCLVLDDGSTDTSPEVAAHVAATDRRFRLHRLPPRGLVPTLQVGLALADAALVARLDADDVMNPERLERQVACLEAHPEIEVVSSRIEYFPRRLSADLVAYERWLNETLDPDRIEQDLFVESPLPHPSVTMRRDAVLRVGGYREGGPEDYDLWFRLWRAGARFAKLPETLTRVRDHPARLTRTDPRYSPRALLECKAEHLVAAKGLVGREIVVWGAGRDGIRTAKTLRRRGVLIRHLVDIAPTKVGKSMIGVPVLPPESLKTAPRPFVVAAVGVKGARALIRARMAGMGYSEGDGFVCFG